MNLVWTTYCFGGFLFAVLLAGKASVAAEPYIPEDPQAVVARLPASLVRMAPEGRDGLQGPQRMARVRDASLAYVEEGLRSGDARYFGYALALLNPLLSDTRVPTELLLPLAMVQQARHEFGQALANLADLLQRRPGDLQAWLMRATVLQVTGDPLLAKNDCIKLAVRGSPLLGSTCLAGSAVMTADLPRAYRSLQRAMQSATEPDRTMLPWALRSLAGLAEASGEVDAALQALDQAQAIAPDDVRTLTARADLLLRMQQPAQVLQMIVADNPVPQLSLRREIAAKHLGREVDPVVLDQLREMHESAVRRGAELHQREAALLYLELLERPVEALRLAQENWRTQREFADAWLVLESARRAGREDGAADVLAWMRDLGNADRRLESLRQSLFREARS
ncbi:MAG: hypothetical protein KDI82_04630 [Gammaproteobacteria bacterium]|nr:hypothetical protein [Gammaproteobacteria bacterium]